MILVVQRVVLGLQFDIGNSPERSWAQVVPKVSKVDLEFHRVLLLGVSLDYFGRPGSLGTALEPRISSFGYSLHVTLAAAGCIFDDLFGKV